MRCFGPTWWPAQTVYRTGDLVYRTDDGGSTSMSITPTG